MKRICYAVLGGILSFGTVTAATACDIVHAYESQMEQGAYAMDLNGIRLYQNDDPGDYFNGGPFTQFLVEGENTVSLTMSKGSADIRIYRGCRGEFDGETLVEAKVTAPETRTLTFFAENAPKQVFDDVPTDDSGLKDALAALKSAVKARDYDTFWNFHKGLRDAAAADGVPEDMMQRMISITVEKGEPSFNNDVTYTSALGGRVWQVLADGGEAPIVIDIKMNGGTNTMRTGAYWAKVDGAWSIVSN